MSSLMGVGAVAKSPFGLPPLKDSPSGGALSCSCQQESTSSTMRGGAVSAWGSVVATSKCCPFSDVSIHVAPPVWHLRGMPEKLACRWSHRVIWSPSRRVGESLSPRCHCSSVPVEEVVVGVPMVQLANCGPEGSLEVKAELLVAELRGYVKTGVCKKREWRVEQLKGIQRLLHEHEQDLADALRSDLAKSSHEAFITELQLAQAAAKRALNQLGKWMSPQKVPGVLAAYPSDCRIVPEPLGVVLVISPWNFPILLSLEPVIGAIAAGNAVVLKPSEVAPASATLLAKLLPEFVDTKAVRVVEGAVAETTALLQQRWDKIFFTGSPQVGRVVMAAAAKHLTPVILELGGKCPTLIDSTADMKISAKRIVSGKWGSNCGQACIAPDYILAEDAIVPQLVDALKNTLKEFYGKDPKLSADISRIVNRNHLGRLTRLLNENEKNVVIGGDWDEDKLYLAPTILLNPPVDSPVMTEEIFGPILPILSVKSVQEGIDFVNSRAKPLALYLFTTNKDLERQVLEDTSAGALLVNDTVIHCVVPGLPFGGVGESGIGAYHGKSSFDAFSHMKSVMSRNFQADPGARFPPFTTYKRNFLRHLLSGDYWSLFLTVLGSLLGLKNSRKQE